MKPTAVNFKVTIADDINGVNESIVREYWDFQLFPPETKGRNNRVWVVDFLNKPKEIIERYSKESLSIGKINTVVRDYSHAVLTLPCEKCGCGTEYILYSRTAVTDQMRAFTRRWASNVCQSCEEERKREREEYYAKLQAKQEQEELERQKKIAVKMKRDAQKRSVAIIERRWEQLTPFEYTILRRIIVISDIKELWGFVFKGNVYDKEVWAAFKAIEKAGLITTERGYRGKLLGVSWNSKLNDVIFENEDIKTIQ